MLPQVLYGVRSERQLMEQVQYNLLFRWFIDLAMDDAVWVPIVFTKDVWTRNRAGLRIGRGVLKIRRMSA